MSRLVLGAAALRLPPACPRCIWLGARGLLRPPPAARMMHEMEAAIRRVYAGAAIEEALPHLPLPPGVLITDRYRPHPAPLRAAGLAVSLRGELDALIEHADGSLSVLDFKFVGGATPAETRARRAAPQLNAYAHLVGRARGRPVRALGLLLVRAAEARAGAGALALGFRVDYEPVPCDFALLEAAVAYTAAAASLPAPPLPGCPNCL